MFTDLFRSALTLCFCLIFNAAQAQFYALFDSLTAYHTDWDANVGARVLYALSHRLS